ncbi:MAG: GAF domain-containing protein [Polymorphobacter sp.]
MSFTPQPLAAAAFYTDRAAAYRDLAQQLTALIGDERDMIANAANTAALLFDLLPDLNWAGFYLFKDGELVLGPFQGKPACIRIPIGRGVCGAAAATRVSQVVADVHAFPGHIACDAASRSELVVPLLRGDTLIGVLDLDSPVVARFDAQDLAGIEAIAAIWVASLPSPLAGEGDSRVSAAG